MSAPFWPLSGPRRDPRLPSAALRSPQARRAPGLPPAKHGRHRAGCLDLLEVVKRLRPACHVFGHVHEGYGATTDGATTFLNASTCSVEYQPTNPPLVFDLPAHPPPASSGISTRPDGGSDRIVGIAVSRGPTMWGLLS